MCVIISKPAGAELPRDIVEDCFHANPDGFGAAWHTGERLRAKKGCWPLSKILRFCDRLTPHRAFLHFRIRTAGPTDKSGCHPYRVAGNCGLMVHNGCLDLPAEESRSDTRQLAEILQTYSQTEIIQSRSALEEWHGGGNRLAFLFADGSSLRTGTWRACEGLQFSNLHWQVCNWSYGYSFAK